MILPLFWPIFKRKKKLSFFKNHKMGRKRLLSSFWVDNETGKSKPPVFIVALNKGNGINSKGTPLGKLLEDSTFLWVYAVRGLLYIFFVYTSYWHYLCLFYLLEIVLESHAFFSLPVFATNVSFFLGWLLFCKPRLPSGQGLLPAHGGKRHKCI